MTSEVIDRPLGRALVQEVLKHQYGKSETLSELRASRQLDVPDAALALLAWPLLNKRSQECRV